MAYTTIKKSSDYFNINLYTGNNTETSHTVGFQPDFTWLKVRNASGAHYLFDAVRGATKYIQTSNASGTEGTLAESLKSFDSNGYTVGTSNAVNTNNETMIGWNWKAGGGQGSPNTDGSINTSYTSVNTTAGFSISKFTGTGANASFGHGLNAIPKVVIIKRLNGSQSTRVGHYELGWSSRLYIDSNSAQADGSDSWNGDPTSALINLSTESGVNGSGSEHIAYCFADKVGYSKFGKYTGNGSTDGTFVYTGFKPAFVMTKRTDSTGNWQILDNKRDVYNPAITALFPDTTDPDTTSYTTDFFSNGFKQRVTSGSRNASGGTYIYMAFAEEPLVGDNPATAR